MSSTRIGRFGAGLAIIGALTTGSVAFSSGTASAAPAPRHQVSSGVHVGPAVAFTRSATGVVHRVR